jgi:hypothetical protein
VIKQETHSSTPSPLRGADAHDRPSRSACAKCWLQAVHGNSQRYVRLGIQCRCKYCCKADFAAYKDATLGSRFYLHFGKYLNCHTCCHASNQVYRLKSLQNEVLRRLLGRRWKQRKRVIIAFFCKCHWPPLWSSDQSSWLQIRRPGFDSGQYQKKKVVVWNGLHSASWVQLRSYLIEK